MGDATEKFKKVMSRPLSEDEIERRQRAAQPRMERRATLNGELNSPTPAPTAVEEYKSPENTID